MFWVKFGRNETTELVLVTGSLNTERYIDEIIVPHVVPAAERVGDDFVFQQDNARPHIAHNVMNHFHAECNKVMNWQASSPDLNPIKNLWANP